jgi:uncharacterized phage protein (TIGR02216 family)
VLRLSPDAFWAMRPRELAFALGAFARPSPVALARDDFAQLMRRFPDKSDTSMGAHNGG